MTGDATETSFAIVLYTEDEIFPFGIHWRTQNENRKVNPLTMTSKHMVAKPQRSGYEAVCNLFTAVIIVNVLSFKIVLVYITCKFKEQR